MLKINRQALGGEPLVGTFYDLDGGLGMEGVALAGMDFAIVDTEHGLIELEHAAEMICRGHVRGMSVLVRPKDFTRASLLKPLDAGADGLVVPQIRTLEDAKSAVRHAKYMPLGQRGVGTGRGNAFGCDPRYPTLQAMFDAKNRESLLLLQCETVDCLESIEEIAALEGVDGIFIGPYDLSAEMGMPGDFENPAFLRALDRIRRACADAGKPTMIFCIDAETARRRIDEGYDSVAVGTAAAIHLRAYQDLLRRCRETD